MNHPPPFLLRLQKILGTTTETTIQGYNLDGGASIGELPPHSVFNTALWHSTPTMIFVPVKEADPPNSPFEYKSFPFI